MAYTDPEQEQQTSTIKPPARNPAASVPGAPSPAVNKVNGAIANFNKAGAPLAQIAETFKGAQAPANPAYTPGSANDPKAVAIQPAASGSPATYRPGGANDPKAVINPIAVAAKSPAASVPGITPPDSVQTRGYVATQSGQMNPAMQRVIDAQPNPLLASVLNGKQTSVPQITGAVGALPVQNVGAAPVVPTAQPKANPIAEAAKAQSSPLPATVSAQVQPSTIAPQGQSLPTGAVTLDAAQAQTTPATDTPPRPNSFTEKGNGPLAVVGPLDSHGNSMAATNELKSQLEEMTRTQPANVTMIENSGLKETQELMDKWGRQDAQREMLQEMSRNPKAAGAIASLYAAGNQTEAQVRGQDMAEAAGQRANDTTQRGQDITAETTRRGQDVNAQGEANRLAGNPLDNQIKQLQVQSGQSALDKASQQAESIKAIQAEKDPAKRQSMIESLLVAQGKNPLADRYIKVDGGEEIGPDGMTKIKRPSGVYDTVTQQFKPMDSTGASQKPAAPQWTVEDYEHTAKKYGMTVEQVKAAIAKQQGAK